MCISASICAWRICISIRAAHAFSYIPIWKVVGVTLNIFQLRVFSRKSTTRSTTTRSRDSKNSTQAATVWWRILKGDVWGGPGLFHFFGGGDSEWGEMKLHLWFSWCFLGLSFQIPHLLKGIPESKLELNSIKGNLESLVKGKVPMGVGIGILKE